MSKKNLALDVEFFRIRDDVMDFLDRIPPESEHEFAVQMRDVYSKLEDARLELVSFIGEEIYENGPNWNEI